VNLDAAREAARLQAASVVQGANPSVERKTKRTAGSVLDVVDAYLRYAKERQKTRSYKETERHLRIHTAPIHHERAEVVGRRDIAALLERVAKNSGPVAANRLRATLSALWIWALRTGLINADSNPVAFTIRHPERARERVLNNAELKAVWGATNDDGDYSRIVRAAARRARSFRTMVAYRDYEYPLLRNGHSANFTTVEEAQRAAEAHASEGYPNSETIYDGFAFLPNADPWWSYPNRIAIRSSVVGSVARRH
jgi:hypothetical protein